MSNWTDEITRLAGTIEAGCPRLADMTRRWLALAEGWLAAEEQLGFPDQQTVTWVSATGAPDLIHALTRAAKEPHLAAWLEDGIAAFGQGVYMAAHQDHEEQGIWVVDFPSAVTSLVRELERE